MSGPAWRLAHDWYSLGMPGNAVVLADTFVETSYGFSLFSSELEPGFLLGEASGAYDRAAFLVGPAGRIVVGAYTCLNSCTLIANASIAIGSHCFFAWGAVVTDTWAGPGVPQAARRAALEAASRDPLRRLPPVGRVEPVVIEDTVWVGFDSVILPGVTLGRGCVVGCKTVIERDVAPYTVVAGDPPRELRRLSPGDDEATRRWAITEYGTRRER